MLRLLLLVGALIGLFSQGLALAHIPAPVASHSQQMSDDCMAMMAKAQQEKRQAPCKGITLDCIAMMGCVVSMTLPEPVIVAAALRSPAPIPGIAVARPLATRTVAPEPEPPALI